MARTIQIYPSDGLGLARSVFQKAKAVVCDIDGVLLTCGQAVAGAQTLLKRRRCVFVSNNSTHTAHSLALEFQSLGLECRSEQFFLAGEAAVEFIASQHPEASVMILASDDIEELACRRLNLFNPSDFCSCLRPDLVLICRDRKLTFEKIESAVNAIRMGASVVVSNLDLTHPSRNGLVHTETGALWQALSVQIGSPAPLAVIGKPNSQLVTKAVDYLGLSPEELVFLGDNLKTDAPAALLAGIPFIHTGGEGFALQDIVEV